MNRMISILTFALLTVLTAQGEVLAFPDLPRT